MKLKLLLLLFVPLFLFGCTDKKNTNDKSEVPAKETANQLSSNDTDEIDNAALNGNIEIVKKYVEKGFDVNTQNQGGQTLLMLAGFNGHTDICEYLIKNGIHIETRDSDGRTALMYASTGPFAQTVEFLIKKGADASAVDTKEHWTPLMFAAAEGQYEVVKLLLDAGADTTIKDVDGDTAESFAIQNKHIDVVKLLREYK